VACHRPLNLPARVLVLALRAVLLLMLLMLSTMLLLLRVQTLAAWTLRQGGRQLCEQSKVTQCSDSLLSLLLLLLVLLLRMPVERGCSSAV
jgi:hypothetical protein